MTGVVEIVCAKAPHRSVPARRVDWWHGHFTEAETGAFFCSYCGARVKVVA